MGCEAGSARVDVDGATSFTTRSLVSGAPLRAYAASPLAYAASPLAASLAAERAGRRSSGGGFDLLALARESVLEAELEAQHEAEKA